VRTRRGHADARTDMPRDLDPPAVVIAHGAWVDATSWREVIALLQVRGLSVVAVQNPLSALADDVDAVMRVLNHQPGSVVLVGHGSPAYAPSQTRLIDPPSRNPGVRRTKYSIWSSPGRLRSSTHTRFQACFLNHSDISPFDSLPLAQDRPLLESTVC